MNKTNYISIVRPIAFLCIEMNNREAWDYLSARESIRDTFKEFMQEFQIEENEYESIRHKFNILKSTRDSSRKLKKLDEWENNTFYSNPSAQSTKKRIMAEKNIVESDLSMETKKPLSQLSLKALRTRLNPLLNLIDSFATKEEVDPKIIATYALMLISNLSKDVNTSSVCKQIIAKGSFVSEINSMPIDKSVFLLDLL